MRKKKKKKKWQNRQKKKDKVAQKHDILNYADGKVGIGWKDDGMRLVGI